MTSELTQQARLGYLIPEKQHTMAFEGVLLLATPLFFCGFPGGSVVKNLPANAGDVRDMGSVSGLGRSPGEGNSNPLEHPMDRGAWRATVHGVAKTMSD